MSAIDTCRIRLDKAGNHGDPEMSSAALINEMARLDLQGRHQLAATLRQVSQTFAEVLDGKAASHVLGVLAHMLEPVDRPTG